MIRRLRTLLARLRLVRPPVDVLIARRAARLNNRKPDAAARYERVHTILDRGRR